MVPQVMQAVGCLIDTRDKKVPIIRTSGVFTKSEQVSEICCHYFIRLWAALMAPTKLMMTRDIIFIVLYYPLLDFIYLCVHYERTTGYTSCLLFLSNFRSCMVGCHLVCARVSLMAVTT